MLMHVHVKDLFWKTYKFSPLSVTIIIIIIIIIEFSIIITF